MTLKKGEVASTRNDQTLEEGRRYTDVGVPTDESPEDDLDAILAQGEIDTATTQSMTYPEVHHRQDDNFDDEMEAMVGLDQPW